MKKKKIHCFYFDVLFQVIEFKKKTQVLRMSLHDVPFVCFALCVILVIENFLI
jgi:hypothetical protein